ncbi:hypothetical protein LOX66_01760 [Bacillus velezensis]|nr:MULTISPECIES: hypothetical protein [Bacillus amyloliquefaciens group]MCC9262733.1 hypothetical protein [Bacillus velezensis]
MLDASQPIKQEYLRVPPPMPYLSACLYDFTVKNGLISPVDPYAASYRMFLTRRDQDESYFNFYVIFIKGASHTPGKDDFAVFGKFAISRPPVNYDLYHKDNSKTVLENVTGYYESSDSQVYVQNNSDFVVINKGTSYEKSSLIGEC